MFCQECGQKLPEGAKHCPYCGAMVEAAPPPEPEESSLKREEESVPEEVFSPEVEDLEEETPPPRKPTQKPKPQPPAPEKAGKHGKAGLYALIGLAAVLVLVVVFIKGAFGGGNEIAVMDCVKVTISGVDTKGTAYFDLDIQPILDAVAKKSPLTERMREDIYERTSDLYKDIAISPISELSNGDKVKVSSNVDPKLLNDYKVKLKNGDKTIKVENLVKVQDVKVKDYMTVRFSGFDGSGSVYMDQDYDALKEAVAALIRKADSSEEAETYIEQTLSSVLYQISCIYDGENDLKNGDEVTYQFSGPEYIEKYGIHFVYEEGSAKAEGLLPVETISLPEYLTLTASGINGSAYVTVSMDEEKLTSYLKEIFEKEQRGAYGAAGETFDAAAEAEVAAGNVKSAWKDQFDTSVNPEEAVSNGDQVTVTVTPYSGEEQVTMRGNGLILTGGTKSDTVEGLGDYHLGIASTEDAEVRKLLAPYEGEMENTFENKKEEITDQVSDTGWIAWDQVTDGKVTPVLEQLQLVTWDGDENYSAGNLLTAIYHMTLPVRQFNRSMTTLDLYYGMSFDSVIKQADGTLGMDYDPSTRFFIGKEDLDSWLTDNKSYMLANGKNAAEEDVTADLSKAPETEAGTETETEGSTEAAEVISVEAPQAGVLPDAAANQAAAMITYEGHIYARYDLPLNYTQAEKFCEQAGGHLATITSWQESRVVRSILEDAAYSEYWLGASDEEWEGGWKWLTGEAFDWTNWNDSQPDNYDGNEDFLTIYSYYGSWNDRPADEEDIGFILEIEPATEGTPSGEYDLLADLTAASGTNFDIWNELEDPYGNRHFGSPVLDASENGQVKYELGGKYSLFTANLSTWNDAESDASFELAIWGDGKLLYSRYNYRKTDAPEMIALNVTGVDKLSIQAANRGAYSNGFLCLNEAKCWKNTAAELPAETVDQLSDLVLIDSYEYGNYSTYGMNTDVYGNVHEDWYDFAEEDEARAVFRLGGKYTSFEGMVLTGIGDYDIIDSANLEISLDGTVVYSVKDLTLYQGGQSFSLDVTGKEILEIRGSEAAYLADSRLIRPAEAVSAEKERYTFPELPEAVASRAVGSRIYKNKKYYRFDQGLTWSQADAFCKAAGGTLAMPKTEAENSAVYDLIDHGNSSYYWLGGSKSGNNWIWNDGEPITDGYWGSSQPDNYEENENLLCMYSYDDSWNDISDQNLGFVLELTAAEAVDENTVLLTGMEWQESSYAESVKAYNGDEIYLSSVKFYASENGYLRTDLNGAYQTLSGIVDVSSDASINGDFYFAVFGDGKLLYERNSFSKKDPQEVFSVDVSGVKQLCVKTANHGTYDSGYLYLIEPELTKAETPASSGIARISDLVLVDGVGESSISRLFVDSYGELHDGCLKLSSGENAKVTYNTGGSYTSFTGKLAAGEDTSYEGSISLKIYGDGNQLYEVTDFGKLSGTQSFEVDITGCQVLEIETTGASGSAVYLVDEQLK